MHRPTRAPAKKKGESQEFVLQPGNTASTVFSQTHTEKEGGRQCAKTMRLPHYQYLS